MYLPSRLKAKFSLLILAGIILFFLSFKSLISHLIFFTAENLFFPHTKTKSEIARLEQKTKSLELELSEYKTLIDAHRMELHLKKLKNRGILDRIIREGDIKTGL